MNKLETPYFQLHPGTLAQNLNKLSALEQESGIKILHTIKSFNHAEVTPIIASKLSGFSVSSSLEIGMAQQAGSKTLHLYAPAFKENELKNIAKEVNTVSLNSLSQWQKFGSEDFTSTSLGLRINPKLHLPIPSYCNPNLAYSRLGVDYQVFLEQYQNSPNTFKSLKGLHFHALFRSSVEGLEILLEHITTYYQTLLPQLKWINLGGGHNLTDENYDTKRFLHILQSFHTQYPHIQLYLEPGEAVLQGCGEFVTSVLDIVDVAGEQIAILDTSIETHLLDVAIVNQRLSVRGTQQSATPYHYALTGNSCLQGDTIGDYFFISPLNVGDKVVFENMMSYTIVKMTAFNGMKSPKLMTSL